LTLRSDSAPLSGVVKVKRKSNEPMLSADYLDHPSQGGPAGPQTGDTLNSKVRAKLQQDTSTVGVMPLCNYSDTTSSDTE